MSRTTRGREGARVLQSTDVSSFPSPGLPSWARFLLSLNPQLLVPWTGTTLILGLARGLNGISYWNVSHAAGHTVVTPQTSVSLPSLRIPAGSSGSLWDVQAKTAAKENSWTIQFIYTVGRLKSLCFDWQELFIGLVPRELLGAGLSPTNLPAPRLGRQFRGYLCGPFLPNHMKAEFLPCSIKLKSLPAVNKARGGRGQRKPSQNDGVELSGRNKCQHAVTRLDVLNLKGSNYRFRHKSQAWRSPVSLWVLRCHSQVLMEHRLWAKPWSEYCGCEQVRVGWLKMGRRHAMESSQHWQRQRLEQWVAQPDGARDQKEQARGAHHGIQWNTGT